MDLPFFNPSQGGGSSGGGGTTNYDALSNRPVTNLIGNSTAISELSSGVYNIKGKWKITEDDTERASSDDDLFYVLNDEAGCKLTWISAGQLHKYTVPVGGKAADIVATEVATTGDIIGQLTGAF